MKRLSYANIFEAIADNTDDAADLAFRADLMLVLRDYFAGASQADIGKALGIPQPRVSELIGGKVDKFSADKLIGFLAKVGIRLKLATVPRTKGRPLKVKCDVLMARAVA